MKATLSFNLPEDQDEHRYALSGVDALLLINDLENEIRSKLRHDCGEFKKFRANIWDEESGKYLNEEIEGDDQTLERVWNWIIEQKQYRNIPELT
jgi:hypothetical protein